MLTQEFADRVARLKVADLADACRDLGFVVQLAGTRLRPAIPFSRLCGAAITCRVYVAPGEGEDFEDEWERLMDLGRSAFRAVLVYLNEASDSASMGSGGARVGLAHGYVGCVMGGGIRDTEELRDVAFPVFGTVVVPRGFRPSDVPVGSSVRLEAGEPVEIDGMLVRPGDVVVGDNDGVIAIGPERIAAVVARAEAIVADEKELLAAIEQGVRLREFVLGKRPD